MKRPFFSLITPVYNIERLIAKTIESALSQTFSDWEIILVDDGSPDNAGKICDEYANKDQRIKVVHKKNEGLAEARNVGIKNATGKYFLILEGSDLFPNENTLSSIYSVLSENEVDIFFGKLQDVNETDGKVFGVQNDYCVNGFIGGGKELFITLFDNEDVLALSSPVNKVFKTDFVKENELWFCKGIYHDDDEWIPRTISLSDKTYFTNDIIYNAMTWDGCFGQVSSEKSLTKKAHDKMFLAEKCLKDIDDRFPEKNTAFKKKYYEYYVRIFIDGVATLNSVKDENYRKTIIDSAKKYSACFKYAGKCVSNNLKILSLIKKCFGINFAIKMIIKRYSAE